MHEIANIIEEKGSSHKVGTLATKMMLLDMMIVNSVQP